MRFHSNAGMYMFTFRPYNPDFFNQSCTYAIIHSNQSSQAFETLSKIPLKNDIFCSTNCTFHNLMMINHIFEHLYFNFVVIFLYVRAGV